MPASECHCEASPHPACIRPFLSDLWSFQSISAWGFVPETGTGSQRPLTAHLALETIRLSPHPQL